MRTYDVTIWGDNLCVVYTVKAFDAIEALYKAERAFFANGFTDYDRMDAEKRG